MPFDKLRVSGKGVGVVVFIPLMACPVPRYGGESTLLTARGESVEPYERENRVLTDTAPSSRCRGHSQDAGS